MCGFDVGGEGLVVPVAELVEAVGFADRGGVVEELVAALGPGCRGWVGQILRGAARLLLAVLRGVPELVWARCISLM